MKVSALLLLSLHVVCSTSETGSDGELSPWQPVQQFFGGVWDKVTGKPAESDPTRARLKPSLNIEDTLNMVSDDQWDKIDTARKWAVSEADGTLALSQLVQEVKDELGQEVANLTDIAMADVLYVMELLKKYSEEDDMVDSLKFLSLNIPFLPMLLRDLGSLIVTASIPG